MPPEIEEETLEKNTVGVFIAAKRSVDLRMPIWCVSTRLSM